ncbi:hypothetical protein OSB04_024426 [Centaurea solstitialis]|uniref:No apical meristem-associated C-terminal domain-containing protein n=1 Tax=Centaurea solstitialis TaxID=347529 RepID=A0AA38SMQ8_9ASTR|nr:hypothetical protein OSB04_024426 [Centaurea solstitialis]
MERFEEQGDQIEGLWWIYWGCDYLIRIKETVLGQEERERGNFRISVRIAWLWENGLFSLVNRWIVMKFGQCSVRGIVLVSRVGYRGDSGSELGVDRGKAPLEASCEDGSDNYYYLEILVLHMQPPPSQVWEPRDGNNLSPQSWGDDEEVPETQPESPPPPPQPKGKKRGKGKNVEASSSANPTKTKAPPKPWSSEEEVELAKAWAETSEDPTIGNYRTRDNFWLAVKRSLDIRMRYGPNVRSTDSVQTKVRLLLSGVSKFACIYNNTLNSRTSGESDVNILERANERYRREYHRTFPHQSAWRVLIECPKYNPVEMMNPSDIRAPTNKRSKTSETQTDSPGDSDARTYMNLGGDEQRSQTERPRPMGRNAARRAGSSSSTTDINTGMSTQVGALAHGITGLMGILKEKQRMAHLQFYTSPHNHLSSPILVTTLREKAQLRAQYDWPPFE